MGRDHSAARRELAALAKRERHYSRATALWQELIDTTSKGAPVPAPAFPGQTHRSAPTASNDTLEAFEQLAIYYEHHAKEPERAAALTRDALRELRQAFQSGLVEPARYRKLKARLENRLKRLERKACEAAMLC